MHGHNNSARGVCGMFLIFNKLLTETITVMKNMWQ